MKDFAAPLSGTAKFLIRTSFLALAASVCPRHCLRLSEGSSVREAEGLGWNRLLYGWARVSHATDVLGACAMINSAPRRPRDRTLRKGESSLLPVQSLRGGALAGLSMTRHTRHLRRSKQPFVVVEENIELPKRPSSSSSSTRSSSSSSLTPVSLPSPSPSKSLAGYFVLKSHRDAKTPPSR